MKTVDSKHALDLARKSGAPLNLKNDYLGSILWLATAKYVDVTLIKRELRRLARDAAFLAVPNEVGISKQEVDRIAKALVP
jgi:hypothetical protein